MCEFESHQEYPKLAPVAQSEEATSLKRVHVWVRLPPGVYRGVAQLEAHLLWEQDVAGSSPATPILTCPCSPIGMRRFL